MRRKRRLDQTEEIESSGTRVLTAPVSAAAGRSLPLRAFELAQYLFQLARLVYQGFASLAWEKGRGRALGRRVLLQQVYFTALQALPLTILVAIASGALFMGQASVQLTSFGMREVEWTTVILFREIGPMVVALVVIARSANAIVIEIGNMRVNGEIRALEVMGINLDRYLVLPRIAGVTLSVVILTAAFCAAAFWGGFYVARHAEILASTFVMERLAATLDAATLGNIFLRAVCFGLVISSVACLHGLKVGLSSTEVPQQASRGVISALSLCFIINFLIATLLAR
jgi:phospholipid/cholesterol/gamma-HCH transport system permease protein